MEISCYNTESLFPYADGYYGILPAGLPDRFYSGKGDKVAIGDEVICFAPNTPLEIKERFVKEYSEYMDKQKAEGIFE